MLCLDEPYASAIFAGLKRWETRTAPPNGDMRPDGVRGFPGVKVNRGDRIIIANTKRRPRHEQHDVNDDLPPWCDLYAFAPFVEWTEHPDDFMHGGMYRWCGPVGVILGTVAVTDVVPIVADCDDMPDAPPLIETLGEPLRWWPEGSVLHEESTDISDQLPWGIWTPGRWASQLADPIPTTDQCPWCGGEGVTFDEPLPDWNADCTVECEARVRCTTCDRLKAPVGRSLPLEMVNGYCGRDCDGYRESPEPGHLFQGELHRLRMRDCPVCGGDGSCPPIPVTGHQGLRVWDGTVRR